MDEMGTLNSTQIHKNSIKTKIDDNPDAKTQQNANKTTRNNKSKKRQVFDGYQEQS